MTNRALSILLLALSGCPSPDPGIAEGIFAPMGEPIPDATPAQRELFARGQAVAEQRFADTDGLGPHFNVASCTACHEKPVFGGSAGRYRNFLLVGQRFEDGSRAELGVNGVQPQFLLDEGRFPTEENVNHAALRNPIPFFGVGLLAEIDEAAIAANADPTDRDGDGISGRPNIDRGFIGRFGRKAQTVSIEGFIRGPLNNHLGITTNPLSAELQAQLPVPSVAMDVGGTTEGLVVSGSHQAQAAAPADPIVDEDDVPDPEMPEEDLFALVSWAMLLAAPEPDAPTAESEAGRALFADANCTGCHVPALEGPRGLIPAYSDLLLHDMGEELSDGIFMGRAEPGEFRTQPLWGIAPVGPYLHDGSADTLDEAIRKHGGEAERSRDAYLAMSEADRALVVEFLLSLGGRSVASEGLVAPDAPVPPAGEFGGPRVDLSAEAEQRFLAGRAVFDRDTFEATGGLGPAFNGDSCRACHFDPIVDGIPTPGGAGPTDVDVTRHGIVDELGEFLAPAQGTMAHRQLTTPERPPFDAMANVVERRQTPTLLGMGLIDAIPEEVILGGADPEDADADGISGRAHVLTDGRLGRFGWKADVPSTAEFIRDAMSAEMGVTVPTQEGLTFGQTRDDDAVADPELSVADAEALEFFLNNLAAPPRVRENRVMEDAGEARFAEIGCADCHATLLLEDGSMVPLFSDLLLHDVAPEEFVGIVSGDATQREFRTPPLWGLGRSAPYMHDGRSFTIEDAIARHEGEATAARQAYEALDESARAELLAFLSCL